MWLKILISSFFIVLCGASKLSELVDFEVPPELDFEVPSEVEEFVESLNIPDNLLEFIQNIKFYIFTSDGSERVESTFLIHPLVQGCTIHCNYAIITHAFNENVDTLWVEPLVNRLLAHRGGCVFFMDYSYYGDATDYFQLFQQVEQIAFVLLMKSVQLGFFDNQYMFGFGFGARLALGVGTAIASFTQNLLQIDRIEVCNPTSAGFGDDYDPKLAAKNVQCIHTSGFYGTYNYNCHQDFRMGYMGHNQPGSHNEPLDSHFLCPIYYTLAFDFEYVPYNPYGYTSAREATLTPGVRMGYLGDYDRTQVRGDIFIMTANHPPYLLDDSIPLENRVETVSYFLYNDCHKPYTN